MKVTYILMPLLGLAISQHGQAQSPTLKDGWKRVRSLSPETHLVIKLRHKRGLQDCWLQRTTADDLICESDDQSHPAIYPKDEIRKLYQRSEFVRVRPKMPPFGVAAAVVVSVPILIVFQGSPASLGIAGGLVGTALLVRHFNHGRLIYRSP